MSRNLNVFNKCIFGLALATLIPLGSAYAQGFRVLYSFAGGSDGRSPFAGLIADRAGNLYGTTWAGGASDRGTVFKLTPNGTATVLHSFTGSDGANPYDAPFMDRDGNLYGTTSDGGTDDAGVVFKLTPGGAETVLYSFTGGNDGGHSTAGLIADEDGNLYGTTNVGGVNNAGVVFKVVPNGTETVLYSFTGGNDGGYPFGVLIEDESGNLYGTASAGGSDGLGVVFKLAPNGTETVLHSFTGNDGQVPDSGLIMDAGGNLYGTTPGGGAHHNGVVFKLAPDGTETVLHSFAGPDGANPQAGLIMDVKGNLFGTTGNGGANGRGAVFGLTPNGKETVIYSFTGLNDGWAPQAGLIMKNCDLYGTTLNGGTSGDGVVFTVKAVSPTPGCSP